MAGGTGGHVFPALAVVDQLRNQEAIVSWLGTRQGIEADLVPPQNIDLHFIDIEGIRGRGLLVFIKAPLLLWRSISQALKVISEFKPQVVLGMGGFASGPGAVAAWLKRIPVVIHEQNSVAGTTNRLTALFARRVMQGFPNTLKKGVWSGNPVRREIAQIIPPQERFEARDGKPKLLVLGGSRGALAINEILPKRLAQIICSENKVSGNISELSNKILKQLSENINSWLINPTGSEGYRTAEVTLGGVDTKELSSKTMMSNKHKNLFFIGEVVDVTGHLGGYNFQWAWSSGYVSGQYA